jgi:hypothetical protein
MEMATAMDILVVMGLVRLEEAPGSGIEEFLSMHT